MATPTKQVKKETTTQPQTSGAGPAYCRLLPYSGVIPVKSVIVEKEMASVLNSVCRQQAHTGLRSMLRYVHQDLENREGERERERGKNRLVLRGGSPSVVVVSRSIQTWSPHRAPGSESEMSRNEPMLGTRTKNTRREKEGGGGKWRI